MEFNNIIELLPEGYKEACWETKTMSRKRGIQDNLFFRDNILGGNIFSRTNSCVISPALAGRNGIQAFQIYFEYEFHANQNSSFQ